MTKENENQTIIALMYDFDKTLTTKDMQEYTFIPLLEMKPKEFWDASNGFSNENGMDQILSYMYMMLLKAKEKDMALNKSVLKQCGEAIEFYPGVLDWFDRINEYAKSKGAILEHYIISSGLKEFIAGSDIGDKFKEIFACEYFYDENGDAVWPLMTVNYTEKTQYLFRINKGVLNRTDDKSLNAVTPADERRIPFTNMIYIGDGMTDIPCMKLVKENGGHSISVYPKENLKEKLNAYTLLRDGRVNFFEEADYTKESVLTKRIEQIIDVVIAKDVLTKEHVEQVNLNHVELGSKVKDMYEEYLDFRTKLKALEEAKFVNHVGRYNTLKTEGVVAYKEQLKHDIKDNFKRIKKK